MKNQIVKRMLAGSMAVVVGAGCVGAYEYSNKESEITVYAEEDKEELKEAAEAVIENSDIEETDEFFKEEAVYVKADASGKTEETTVTEWLKNAGNGEISDMSELSDIENIKGEEEFTEGNSGELKWKAEGEDIYYQGTTDKELPVEVKVSYKLDGKDITAENLKGKDGKVEIHIDYVNKSKETVDVNGEETQMYTPFTMVTALMLPTEEYKNVQIDNGKIVSDADKDIVVGLAFPGLKENLKLEGTDVDIDIPENVTITADVKNASVGPTMTVASADIIDKLGFDKVNDFDSFGDSIDELDDAARQLVDGSKEAADGSQTLADGVNTLNSKGTELIAGVDSLAAGVNEYTGGVNTLAAGSADLAAGAWSVDGGAKEIQAGIVKAQGGVQELCAGLDTMEQKVTGSLTDISANLNTVNGALDNALAMLNTGGTGTYSADTVPTESTDTIVANAMAYVPADLTEEQKAAVSGAIAAAVEEANANQEAIVVQADMPSPQDIIGAAKQGITDIQTSINNGLLPQSELVVGFARLKNGAGELKTGLDTLSVGSMQLVAGTESLAGGAQTLADGAQTLNASSSLLTAGTSKLQQGGLQLTSGTGQLADGANALATGNKTLADGMSEFKTSGIDKLTEIFNGDIKNVTARLEAMSELGQNYVSFAGIKDGTKGSTKFIIETKGVE